MSNASRIGGKREKKERQPRAKKVKVNLDALPDAVVDGKLTVPVNGRVVFVRITSGKSEVHEGNIASINEDTGDLTVWDETRGQYWLLNLKQPMPIMKAITSSPSKTP